MIDSGLARAGVGGIGFTPLEERRIVHLVPRGTMHQAPREWGILNQGGITMRQIIEGRRYDTATAQEIGGMVERLSDV